MDSNQEDFQRFNRQVILPGVGTQGQENLRRARVLIVGLGGLGCPAAQYLAAAGIGTLGLSDLDRVDRSNLHRQVLYPEAGIGEAKVAVAARQLQAQNPGISLRQHPEGITPGNAMAIIPEYDLVLDCTDNFPARYLVNDAAALCGIPCIHGSIFQYEGQITLFHPAAGFPCYRCLFPEMPSPEAVPNCAEAGVLGALCGIIGSWQANEAIKWILSLGEPLAGRLKVIDSRTGRDHLMQLHRDPSCPLCGDNPRITAIYPAEYRFPACQPMEDSDIPVDIDVVDAAALLGEDPTTILLDVREPHELAVCSTGRSLDIPLGELPDRLSELPAGRRILVICHHGHRSRSAAVLLRNRGFTDSRSIAGGIEEWARRIDESVSRY